MEVTATPAMQALLVFVALTGVLALISFFYRGVIILTGKANADSWTRDAGKWQDPTILTRVQHAHLNCLENLPLFAALVLVAALIGEVTVIDQFAFIFIGLRVAQVMVHIIAVNHLMVLLRATCYFPQIGLLGYWTLKLLGLI